MRRCILCLALFALAIPAWCGKKMRIEQLQELLLSLQRDRKSDADVASALEQVELTEQLTRSTMTSLAGLVNGPLATEQIYVLEARSADLTPPPSDLPGSPTPDPAAQKAILTLVETYITNSYEQLPLLAATKTTLRFQDHTNAWAASPGIGNSAKETVASSGFSNPVTLIRYMNATARPVVIEHGAEKRTTEKDPTRWGANGSIEIQKPEPGLGLVFKEAQGAGTIRWLRWELIDGKPAAVFSFDVPRQKSKLAIDVCCFPDPKQAGIAPFYSAALGRQIAGPEASRGGSPLGSFHTNTEWHPFRTIAPYRGTFFIGPDSGIVLRMIIESELQPSDVVHQMDIRIDYARVKAGPSSFVVPVKTVINSVVVPNGDSGAGRYSTLTTLFSSEYSDYRPAASK